MQPVKFLKFLRQFVVLVERNLQLIWNDKLLLASLTLQSPFMVLVVKLTADPNCFTSNLVNIGSRTALFVLAAMATFMGTLNSYREICREREIILREASVGVSLPAVVLSKAAVDSEDLSLNISRETLQKDNQLKLMRNSLEKKIKNELHAMLVNDREKYETFWKNFGRQIKFGIYGDYGMHKDLLGDLLMFYSAKEKKLGISVLRKACL